MQNTEEKKKNEQRIMSKEEVESKFVYYVSLCIFKFVLFNSHFFFYFVLLFTSLNIAIWFFIFGYFFFFLICELTDPTDGILQCRKELAEYIHIEFIEWRRGRALELNNMIFNFNARKTEDFELYKYKETQIKHIQCKKCD